MDRDREPNPHAAISPAVELTDRQRSVLRAVVEDYVLTAVPVGSKSLVSRYGLAVSPATVRSAMAELEALGLLTHPHTSAGRVPTERGVRAWVDSSPAGKLHPWDRTHLDSAGEASDPVTVATHFLVSMLLIAVSVLLVLRASPVSVPAYLGYRTVLVTVLSLAGPDSKATGPATQAGSAAGPAGAPGRRGW